VQHDLQLSAAARVIDRILEGDHPIAAWRHIRGMDCEALAQGTGIELPRIYALDHELEIPTDAELDRLAQVLDAPRELMVAPQDDSDELGTVDFLA
jgi:hypothetical protein